MVVFRWFIPTEPKSNSIFVPNPEQAALIDSIYLLILNGGLGVLVVLYLIRLTAIDTLPESVKYLSLGLFVVLELVCCELLGNNDFLTDVGRVILMVAALSRIDIDKTLLIGLFLVGVLMSPSELTYSLFILAIYLTILIKGFDKTRYHEVWVLLLIIYFIYTINQFVWYFIYENAADTPCRLIELHLLVTTPFSYLLMPDSTQGRVSTGGYNPSISLSGFEDGEEEEREPF